MTEKNPDDKKQPPQVKKPAAERHEKRVRDYWTPERLEEANKNPKPLPRREPKMPHGRKTKTDAPQATQVSNPNAVPYVACGKLFFTWNNANWVGSAAIIDANVFLTAAHNVYDFENGAGSASTNIIFFPAYKDGSHTSPSFVPDKVLCSPDWAEDAYAYDYAMCHVPADMKKAGFTPLTLDCTTQPGKDSKWDSLGYPAASPFDGKNMYESKGTYVADQPGIMGMKPNDMTQGASGGPWLVLQNGAPTSLVNGLNSSGTDDEMFSPIFDQAVQKLFIQIKA